jgi:hypothetical protein
MWGWGEKNKTGPVNTFLLSISINPITSYVIMGATGSIFSSSDKQAILP